MKPATLLIVLSIFVVGSALAFIMAPSESQIPPTPAYPTIHIINNATWPNSSDTSITAIKYNDEWILAADDSILINITSLTP